MNRADIKQRILSGINDLDVDAPVFFSGAQLNSLIDEAAEFVAAETRSLRSSSFVPLYAGTTFYSLRGLARDLMLPYRVWSHANSTKLTVTSMEELDQFQQRWSDTTGTPEMWFPVSWDIIGLFPRPSSSGGTLRIDYYAWPTSQQDESANLSNTLSDAVVLYGIYMGLLKQWDAERAAAAFQRLQHHALFDKAKSGILRIGHRSFGRTNLDLPNSIRTEIP